MRARVGRDNSRLRLRVTFLTLAALGLLLARRLRLIGSTLRTRSVEEKQAIVEAFLTRFGADLAAGQILPTIHQVFELADAPEAHRLMKASGHFGKIVLRVREPEA